MVYDAAPLGLKITTAGELLQLLSANDPRWSLVERTVIHSGSVVTIETVGQITVPNWLKAYLPRGVSLSASNSLIDLSLPFSNPFYDGMVVHMKSSGLKETLDKCCKFGGNVAQALVLGSSG